MHNSALFCNCFLIRSIFVQIVGKIFCHPVIDFYNAISTESLHLCLQ